MKDINKANSAKIRVQKNKNNLKKLELLKLLEIKMFIIHHIQ